MAYLAAMPEKGQTRQKYCAAMTSGGTPCRKAPMVGNTLCRNHYGATGVQKRNAAKRLELARAHAALARIGVDADQGVDPRALLLQAVSVTHQVLEAVIEMTRALEEDDINAIGMLPIPGMGNTARGARAEAYLELVGQWTDRAAKVSKAALDAGLDERMVHLAERQAELLVGVVLAALAEAGVQESVRAPFLRALAAKMRLFKDPVAFDLPTSAEAAKARQVGLPYELMPAARHVSPPTDTAAHREEQQQAPDEPRDAE